MSGLVIYSCYHPQHWQCLFFQHRFEHGAGAGRGYARYALYPGEVVITFEGSLSKETTAIQAQALAGQWARR